MKKSTSSPLYREIPRLQKATASCFLSRLVRELLSASELFSLPDSADQPIACYDRISSIIRFPANVANPRRGVSVTIKRKPAVPPAPG